MCLCCRILNFLHFPATRLLAPSNPEQRLKYIYLYSLIYTERNAEYPRVPNNTTKTQLYMFSSWLLSPARPPPPPPRALTWTGYGVCGGRVEVRKSGQRCVKTRADKWKWPRYSVMAAEGIRRVLCAADHSTVCSAYMGVIPLVCDGRTHQNVRSARHPTSAGLPNGC